MKDDNNKNTRPSTQPTIEHNGREYPLYGQNAKTDSYCPPPPYSSKWAERERCPSQISLSSGKSSKSSSHADSITLRRTDSELSLS